MRKKNVTNPAVSGKCFSGTINLQAGADHGPPSDSGSTDFAIAIRGAAVDDPALAAGH